MKTVLASLLLCLACCSTKDLYHHEEPYRSEDIKCVTTKPVEITLNGTDEKGAYPKFIAVRVNYVLSGAVVYREAAGYNNEHRPGPLVLSAETLSYWMTNHGYKFCEDIDK